MDALSFVPGGGSLTVGTYSQPFGSGGSDQFAGHKDDPETSQKYFGARYYHSSSTRWTSPDAVLNRPKDPQSLNKYAYVRNDPVNFVDPDGNFREGLHWESWWFDDPPSSQQAHTRAGDSKGGGSGTSASKGPWSTTWNFGKHEECRKQLISLGMNPDQIPSLEATRWVVDAYLVTGASPDVVAAVWSVESAYKMTMYFTENKDKNGEVWSRDWGPLQLNDYWKLDNPVWNKLYNPDNLNLREGGNPFLSLIAGAYDLADHGARNGEWWAAADYWHSSKEPGNTIEYRAKVGERQAGLWLFFKCLNKS